MNPQIINGKGKKVVGSEHKKKGERAVRPVLNDLTGLKEFRGKMDQEDITIFREKYGKIDAILDIESDWGAIEAMVDLFDPEVKCFTLPHLDLASTLEEYYDGMMPSLHSGQEAFGTFMFLI